MTLEQEHALHQTIVANVLRWVTCEPTERSKYRRRIKKAGQKLAKEPK